MKKDGKKRNMSETHRASCFLVEKEMFDKVSKHCTKEGITKSEFYRRLLNLWSINS